MLPTQRFPRLPASATFVAEFCVRDTKMFLTVFRNILCPQQMFPSLRSPRNIMGNNVSATMRRRLPGPYDSAQANRIRSLSRVICILKIARPRLISKLTGNSKIKEKLCLHTEKSKLFDITLREMLPGEFHLKLYLHQLNLPTVPSTSTTCNQPRFLQCVYSTEFV